MGSSTGCSAARPKVSLPAARTDPRGRMLSEPADDLGGGAVLRRVMGGCEVWVHRRRE